MLLGIPRLSDGLWTLLVAVVNFLLLAMVLDRLYSEQLFFPSHDLSFVRVGYVSSTTAELLIREPRANMLTGHMAYRNVPSEKHGDIPGLAATGPWKSANAPHALEEETDYTGRVVLRGLHPDTRYEYNITGFDVGFFTTAPSVGKLPRGTNATFTFLHTSCVKSRVPYRPPPLAHPLNVFGFQHLAKWIPTLQAQFMLFLGDFIYVDVPWRFGSDVATYRQEYRQVYASPDWKTATAELPWYHVYDDHEIANDWSNGTSGVFPAAYDAFQLYQESVNPPPFRNGLSYFAFTSGPASFFMLDTRRYRSFLHDEDVQGKTMLGTTQLNDFLGWLKSPMQSGVRWKIVVSSVPFTKNWWIGGRLSGNDTWGGFMHERNIVLDAMWDATAKGVGVIVLSGDRHEFAATRFPPPEGDARGRKPVVEFSTSPLSMFWLPFQTYDTKDRKDECIKYDTLDPPGDGR